MAHFRVPLLASLVLLLAATVAIRPEIGRGQTPNHLVISEVYYDAIQTGTDTAYEWVEVFNPTAWAVVSIRLEAAR